MKKSFVAYFLSLCFAAISLISCQTKQLTTPSVSQIEYSYGEHKKQNVTVAIPNKIDQSQPFVIWIHGGGWAVGDKKLDFFLQDSLSAHHIASANMNYRLTSIFNREINYEDQFADVDSIFKYVQANKADWGI